MDDENLPKKPNEIFEIRLQKVTSVKEQQFIVLEILEQSQTVINSQKQLASHY
jgi:hypothetical protein